MKIEVNISKKTGVFIAAAILILAATISVIAYNSNPADPSIMGHSISELDWNVDTFTYSFGPGCSDDFGTHLYPIPSGPWAFCMLDYVSGCSNQQSAGCGINKLGNGNWQGQTNGEASCRARCFR